MYRDEAVFLFFKFLLAMFLRFATSSTYKDMRRSVEWPKRQNTRCRSNYLNVFIHWNISNIRKLKRRSTRMREEYERSSKSWRSLMNSILIEEAIARKRIDSTFKLASTIWRHGDLTIRRIVVTYCMYGDLAHNTLIVVHVIQSICIESAVVWKNGHYLVAVRQ